jgi:hypothetical protein
MTTDVFVYDEVRGSHILNEYLEGRAGKVSRYLTQVPPDCLRVGMVVMDNEGDVGTVVDITNGGQVVWVDYPVERADYVNPFGWKVGRSGVRLEAIAGHMIEELY